MKTFICMFRCFEFRLANEPKRIFLEGLPEFSVEHSGHFVVALDTGVQRHYVSLTSFGMTSQFARFPPRSFTSSNHESTDNPHTDNNLLTHSQQVLRSSKQLANMYTQENEEEDNSKYSDTSRTPFYKNALNDTHEQHAQHNRNYMYNNSNYTKNGKHGNAKSLSSQTNKERRQQPANLTTSSEHFNKPFSAMDNNNSCVDSSSVSNTVQCELASKSVNMSWVGAFVNERVCVLRCSTHCIAFLSSPVRTTNTRFHYVLLLHLFSFYLSTALIGPDHRTEAHNNSAIVQSAFGNKPVICCCRHAVLLHNLFIVFIFMEDVFKQLFLVCVHL